MRVLPFAILVLWLLSGLVAAFIVADTRPLKPIEVALGPISLARVLK